MILVSSQARSGVSRKPRASGDDPAPVTIQVTGAA